MAVVTRPVVDAATFEVIRNALLTLAAEMKVVTQRVSYSPIWRESGDMSCAVLDRNAELVAQGPADLPMHLATMPYSLRGALARIPPEELVPGDLIFMNDPHAGNNHLPDCLLINPVFDEGEICAYVAVRGHWPDIGGASAGGYVTLAGDSLIEGLRIPPLRLWRAGELDMEMADLILANVRGRRERFGDLRAQYAGCQVGARRFTELVTKYGRDTLLETMREILDRSERLTRAEIARIPNGEYVATVAMDGDGLGDEVTHICARVVVNDDRLTVDLTGSSPQGAGGMNMAPAATISAVQCAIKISTDPTTPANSGCYRAIEVIAPEGSIVNPRMPARVVGGNVETAARIVEAVLSALDQASPERVYAPSSGGAALYVIAGEDPRTGDEFIYMENCGGVWGARHDADGINATRVGVGNTGNQPVEIVEIEYPVSIERYELVPDTGGAGRYRGGLSARRVIKVHADVDLTVCADGLLTPIPGKQGGAAGAPARYVIDAGTDQEKEIFSKVGPMPLRAGQTVTIEPPGPGGYGPPQERAAADIERDIREGYISEQAAHAVYGWPGR